MSESPVSQNIRPEKDSPDLVFCEVTKATEMIADNENHPLMPKTNVSLHKLTF